MGDETVTFVRGDEKREVAADDQQGQIKLRWNGWREQKPAAVVKSALTPADTANKGNTSGGEGDGNTDT
jgi:hypothetical protein